MHTSLFVTVFSCFIASTLAVKCFVCTSLKLDNDAEAKYKDTTAYAVRSCQKSASEDCASSFVKKFTVGEYYLGKACASFDGKVMNTTDERYVVECAQGCAKIQSNVVDRGADVSRTTRQCAYYDNDVVGKYMNQPGFKRTGAGSDKVANWFYYCNTDFCNAASGLTSTSAIMIASFYGIVAFLYQ